MRKNYDDELFMEPDPSSSNTDASFDEEMMQLYFAMGNKPESLHDPKERKMYEKWLKANNKTV